METIARKEEKSKLRRRIFAIIMYSYRTLLILVYELECESICRRPSANEAVKQP